LSFEKVERLKGASNRAVGKVWEGENGKWEGKYGLEEIKLGKKSAHEGKVGGMARNFPGRNIAE
jgi:hypothetical protein